MANPQRMARVGVEPRDTRRAHKPRLKVPETVSEMREALRKRNWTYFYEAPLYGQKIRHVYFRGRVGIHLGRLIVAIIARKQFVVIRRIGAEGIPYPTMVTKAVLNPLEADTGYHMKIMDRRFFPRGKINPGD